MKLQSILGTLAVLFISNISLVNAQQTSASPLYNVTQVNGGSIQNKEVSATITMCEQQDPSQCNFITLNRSAFLDLMAGQTVKSHRNDNPSVDISAEWKSGRFRISASHDTSITLNASAVTLNQMTLTIAAHLVSPVQQLSETGQYATLDIKSLTIPKEKFHALKSWLGLSLTGAELKYRDLNDCEFAAQLVHDTSPLFVKAIDLFQNNANFEDFVKWRNETFQPQYEALRQVYDPIDYRYNRELSKAMHENYLLPMSDLVAGISTRLSTARHSPVFLSSAKRILRAAYQQNTACEFIPKKTN